MTKNQCLFDISAYRIDRGKFVTQQQEGYKRYALSEDGISPRTIPGVGNFFISNSDEHDEIGFSNEDIENRIVQMNKRMSKLETCAKSDMPEPVLYGPKDADLTIVSWGSNKGSILQALKSVTNVNYLHIGWMNPFPSRVCV
jgi:2-oxoglutarate/2-oxoacid ferredoxin oxidoreductase subunit alpha